MSDSTIGRGRSPQTIAMELLPHASDVELAAASEAIAQANGVSTTQRLSGNVIIPHGLDGFVPPFLQATINKDVEIPDAQVVPGAEPLGFGFTEGEEKKIGATMNCHGAAFPAVRA